MLGKDFPKSRLESNQVYGGHYDCPYCNPNPDEVEEPEEEVGEDELS